MTPSELGQWTDAQLVERRSELIRALSHIRRSGKREGLAQILGERNMICDEEKRRREEKRRNGKESRNPAPRR